VKQLHRKLKFLVLLQLFFFLGAESSWSYTCLDEKHAEELKKWSRAVPKHAINNYSLYVPKDIRFVVVLVKHFEL
jgi:hypothetical protein